MDLGQLASLTEEFLMRHCHVQCSQDCVFAGLCESQRPLARRSASTDQAANRLIFRANFWGGDVEGSNSIRRQGNTAKALHHGVAETVDACWVETGAGIAAQVAKEERDPRSDVTTGYLGHLIRTVCGDGAQWDLKVHYTEEAEPLGTIGPLSLLRPHLDSTFLVINGDVLTDLNLSAFLALHRRSGCALTIATARRTTRMDFGIIEDIGGKVALPREAYR